MKKHYETRNKFVKWFTIFVIVAFLVTLVGSGIVAFIGNNSEKKTQVINTLNKPLEKEVKEVNNTQSQPGELIQTGAQQK